MKAYKFIKTFISILIGCVSGVILTAPFVYLRYPLNILVFGAVLTLLIFVNDCIADKAKQNSNREQTDNSKNWDDDED